MHIITLTSTALSRTTCETDSRNWAAIPGLFKPRVNLRSAISLINKTKEIIKNTAMQSKNIHSIVSVAWVAHVHALPIQSGVHAMYCVCVFLIRLTNAKNSKKNLKVKITQITVCYVRRFRHSISLKISAKNFVGWGFAFATIFHQSIDFF